MQEFINKVSVVGKLVKNNLEEKNSTKGEFIGGELVLRTSDNSEHEIKLFSYRYKKDSNGNFTQEESKLYKAYKTIIEEYKDMEKYPENPDVIKIDSATIGINDYKSPKDGEVKSYNQMSTKFSNRVELKDLETTPQEANFEVEGIIESITDEVIKNEPTGNKKVILNTIEFRSDGFGKDAKVEPFALIPITLVVPKGLVDAFVSGGYYEGCLAKLNGKVINTTETIEIVEKQNFGADLHKITTKTIKKLEIVSGGNPKTIYDVGLTDDIIKALISKRKLKVAEVKAGKAIDSESTSTTPSAAPTTFANPFAQK